MADKKISALPVATTPLAGTEVLPIVQGGTTDQVSVANLTVGRAVSALSVSTTQDVTTGRNIVVTDAGRIEQNGAAGGLYFINTAVSAGATNQRFYTTNASGVAQLQLQMTGGTTPINQIYGNLTASTGNFVIGTTAKGITTGSSIPLGIGVNNTVTAITIDTASNVGIGTASPAATAILDVQSTTKGVRFPNMTTAQKNAITPSAGTVIFDTTLSKLCVYSGAAWQTITSV